MSKMIGSAAAAMLAMGAFTAAAAPITRTWTRDADGASASGTWSSFFNSVSHVAGWNATPAPGTEAGDIAQYNDSNRGATTTLDVDDVVLGKLQNINRQSWTIAVGTATTITFQPSTGPAFVGTTSNRGSLTVKPSLTLDGNVMISTPPAASESAKVTISGAVGGAGDIGITSDSGTSATSTYITLSAVNSVGSISLAGKGRINLNGTLGANVSTLTKGGSGTTVLAGLANVYMGGTFVNAGVLQVNSGSSLGAPAPLEIASGAALTLNGSLGTVQGTVTKLKLGGVAMTAPGTYGSTSSSATYKDNTYFAGTGMVKLAVPGTVVTVW